MELANIEKLLEKYLEGNTTLQEEKILREYFTLNNVAPHLKEYVILFEYFKQNQQEITYTNTIKLKSSQKKKHFKWISIAASLTLLISSVFVGKQEYKKYQQRKQFAQIKEALEMVSFNLNRGNDELYAVSDNLVKGNNAVQQLKTFPETFNKANKILNNKK